MSLEGSEGWSRLRRTGRNLSAALARPPHPHPNRARLGLGVSLCLFTRAGQRLVHAPSLARPAVQAGFPVAKDWE